MPGVVPRLEILAAALLFSTGGAAIKACQLSSWQIACLRSAIAVLLVLGAGPATRGQWSWRAWMAGAGYAATMILFVSANKLTTAANTIFLQSTAPLYVLLLGPWLLGEPIRRRDLAFMAALAAGLLMLLWGRAPDFETAPDPSRGNLLAALSGLSWALTVVSLRWVARGEASAGASTAAIAAGNLVAFAACAPLALPIAAVRTADWLLVGYLGVVQIGIAYLFLAAGIHRVKALEASLLLLLEPVLNPIWAWLAHGEEPGAWALGGGALILAATAAKVGLDSRDSV